MKEKINKDNCKVKRCRKCLAILTKENSKEYVLKTDYLCNICHRKSYEPYKEKDKIQERNNSISTYIQGKNIVLYGNKRPYPQDNKCEICNEEVLGTYKSHLEYHHWNDQDLKQGIWCCHKCHKLLGAIEYKRHIFLQKALQLIFLRSK